MLGEEGGGRGRSIYAVASLPLVATPHHCPKQEEATGLHGHHFIRNSRSQSQWLRAGLVGQLFVAMSKWPHTRENGF